MVDYGKVELTLVLSVGNPAAVCFDFISFCSSQSASIASSFLCLFICELQDDCTGNRAIVLMWFSRTEKIKTNQRQFKKTIEQSRESGTRMSLCFESQYSS